MTVIKAETILSSERIVGNHNTGHRLTTMLLTYPRCIHAEFMTHRVFSRNAASSRAIPVARLLQDVIDHPFIPLHWGLNQPGMQATAESHPRVWVPDTPGVPNRGHWFEAEAEWLKDRDAVVEQCYRWIKAGYHKQIINRKLEPYAHIKVLVTGDQWSNFLALRDHPAAEPHIQLLAKEIRKELDKPPMQFLVPGQWHLPWVTMDDWMKFDPGIRPHVDLIKLSIARNAHTSYQTVDGKEMTFNKAQEVADSLLAAEPLHASPAEHIAYADRHVAVSDSNTGFEKGHWSGNFKPGFVQYRKTLANECL